MESEYGVNVLLMGPSGTGKTYSIGTLVDSGMPVFYVGLESGLESLLGYFADKKKVVPSNLHWHILEAPKASFGELLDSAKKINSMALDSIAKMQDPHRGKYNTFLLLIECLNNFVDQRTGEAFGAVDEWDSGRILVMDGMTGLARAAMQLVVGGKPVRSQSDWGIAQDQVEKLVFMLTNNCKVHFVLIAHVEREIDSVLGGVKIMISTLGKALSPKMPAMFSDVILAVREGSKFTWDTGSASADVKTRNLKIASQQEPSFKTILQTWKNRTDAAKAAISVKEETAPAK